MTNGALTNTPLDVRLQNLIAGWQGGQRGESLFGLHTQCVESAGRESPLLPARLYFVDDLNATTLRQALKHSSAQVRFQVAPDGHFDAALVPIGKAHGPLDRFVFAVENALTLRDQQALYAHAVGHLLLNEQARLLERGLNLDPDSGMTHWDRLAILRYVETVRNLADRRVLEGFPTTLTKLIEPPAEGLAVLETIAHDLQQRLFHLGWERRGLLVAPYTYTDGRVLPGSERRLRRQTVDVLLRASSSLPIAVVHGQRANEALDEALRRAQSSALYLRVPFAFVLETQGGVREFDFTEGGQPVETLRSDLPERDELISRWLTLLHLDDAAARNVLFYPYEPRKSPRYYQDAAVNRALMAILLARRGEREKRVLLTLATGTGKTRVAFQLLWKLKQTRAVRNVLFLADRSYLLSQAANKDFSPFSDGIWRAEGEPNMSYDFVFASYQWLTTRDRAGIFTYEKYEPGYFDVIIIDECHRGSASEDSAWRRVLAHFSDAVQVGLTATPLDSGDIHTQTYFGPAVYSYSLSRGINDGFLAPYRVRRVMIGLQDEADLPSQAQPDAETPSSGLEVLQPQTQSATAIPSSGLDQLQLQHNPQSSELAEALVMETSNTMRQYTRAIADHLALYLQQSDPRAKTIVFCVNNEHAAEMRAELQRACADWLRASDVVRVVDDDGREGKLDLENFCSVTIRKPVIVTTSKLLSTGIDAPLCKNIVLARGVGSKVEFKQIIGRGTRLSGREKTWFTILDYAGAIKHFFDPDFDGNPESIISETLVPSVVESEQAEQPDTPTADPDTVHVVPGVVTEAQQPYELAPTSSQDGAVTAPGDAPDAPPPFSSSQETLPVTPAETAAVTIPPVPEDVVASLVPSAEQALEVEPAPVADTPTVPVEAGSVASEGSTAPPVSTKAGAHSTASPRPEPPPVGSPEPSTEGKPEQVIRQSEDGHLFVVRDELLIELGADSRLLRSRPAHEWAKLTLQSVVNTPDDLRARWREPLQRVELVQMLDEQVVPLEMLAETMKLTEVDPLDMLLLALFALPVLSRTERVARLRTQHTAFFQRFAASPLAVRVLDAILDWYVRSPIYAAAVQESERLDVSDPRLLNLPALAALGDPMEVAQAFQQCGLHFRTALKELKRLLYTV